MEIHKPKIIHRLFPYSMFTTNRHTCTGQEIPTDNYGISGQAGHKTHVEYSETTLCTHLALKL